MTSNFYDILINELKNDPLGLGYSSMTDREVAEALSAKTRTKVFQRFISLRALAAVLTAEEYAAVKQAIETLAAYDPRVNDMLKFLEMPCDDSGTTGGIDFGHSAVREVILNLPGVTEETKRKMLALAEMPCARWEEIGLECEPNEYHVRSARKMMEE